MTAFLIVSYLAGIAAWVHGFTTPQSRWVAADRDRTYWLVTTATLTVLALGIVAAAVYLIGVVPRFGQSRPSPFSNDA